LAAAAALAVLTVLMRTVLVVGLTAALAAAEVALLNEAMGMAETALVELFGLSGPALHALSHPHVQETYK
jgi:hypothetical protein